MKHQPDIATARWMSRYDRRPRSHVWFPRLECEFQSRRGPEWFGDGEWPPRRGKFYRDARAALRADSSRTLWLEGVVFGLVAIVCAWPIATVIHQAYLIWH